MSPRWLFFPSTGQRLIIHDQFSGSGNLEGRTPDTVDNGNTWDTGGATAWDVSSGYAYMSSVTYHAMIDPETTTYRVEWESKTTTTRAHGIWFRYDGDSANIRSTLFLNSSQSLLQLFERVGSSNVVTTLHSGLSGLVNTPLYWTVDVDGSSITYDLATSSGSVASGTTTLQNSLGSVGVYHDVTGTSIQSHDFKVYA
jgi:hemolysin activation/secretion protein